MKIGLRLPQTDKHYATKENIISLAKGAENAGCFDSLWVLERLIWPIIHRHLILELAMANFQMIGSTYLSR
jgi:hypothetical protein